MTSEDGWTEVIYNGSYGGFRLSDKAVVRLRELKNDDAFDPEEYYENDHRTDPDLIRVFHELGDAMNGPTPHPYSDLRAMKIRKGETYCIDGYDGLETIVTSYDDWRTA